MPRIAKSFNQDVKLKIVNVLRLKCINHIGKKTDVGMVENAAMPYISGKGSQNPRINELSKSPDEALAFISSL
jgi:hypothetical protein